MKVYSHRGESKYAPENTMSAFYLAKLINSDGIECDIRKTLDDKLVLIHDKKIDRTSNSKGNVCDYTYDELMNFDFGNKNYKNEHIVKLTDFLKYFSTQDIKLYLEIKEKGYEDLIVKTIFDYNLKNIVLISFKYEILKSIRELSKDLNLGWLVYDINQKVISESNKIGINQLLCLAANITKKDKKLSDENNIKLVAWGLKNVSEIKRLDKLNIDAIIYDSAYDAKKILNNEK